MLTVGAQFLVFATSVVTVVQFILIYMGRNIL